MNVKRAVAVLTAGFASIAGAVTAAPAASAASAHCITTSQTGSIRTTACTSVTSVKESLLYVGGDGVKNPKGATATLTCTVESSITSSKSLNVSVEASVSADIFALAKASVKTSAGQTIVNSVSEKKTVSVSRSVPGGKTLLCDRDVDRYKITGKTVYTTTNASGVVSTKTVSWTQTAPTRMIWVFTVR